MLRCVKLSVASSVIALTSCSYIYGDHGVIQNRDVDYLKATTTPPLRIPPGLSSSTIEAHYPISEKVFPESAKKVNLTPPELEKPFVMPDIRPVRGSQPNIASENAPASQTLPPQNVPNSYYDPYTRASSSSKAGMPIGEVFLKIWPWGSKTTTTNTTTASSTKSTGFSWPWSKKTATPTQPQAGQEDQNNTGNPAPEKSTMPAMYYDNYSQHR